MLGQRVDPSLRYLAKLGALLFRQTRLSVPTLHPVRLSASDAATCEGRLPSCIAAPALTDTRDTVSDVNKWANAALTRFGGGERQRVGVVVMLAGRMVHAVLAAHPRPPFEVL